MGNVGKATPDVPNQGWGLYIVSVVMVIVSGVFVSIRIGVRVARRMMGMDDWMIIMVRVHAVERSPLTVLTGSDIAHLPHPHGMPW